MTCREVQELIDLYLVNEIDPRKKINLRSHLAACEDCRKAKSETKKFVLQLVKDVKNLPLKVNDKRRKGYEL